MNSGEKTLELCPDCPFRGDLQGPIDGQSKTKHGVGLRRVVMTGVFFDEFGNTSKPYDIPGADENEYDSLNREFDAEQIYRDVEGCLGKCGLQKSLLSRRQQRLVRERTQRQL